MSVYIQVQGAVIMRALHFYFISIVQYMSFCIFLPIQHYIL